MNRTIWIMAGVLSASLFAAVWATSTGLGAPIPEKEPPSIREGSAAGRKHVGRSGTRYFIGGGLLRGK